MHEQLNDQLLNRFIDACHEVAARRLVRCSCGNLSMRVDDERFLVTATGSWMERMSREHAALCRIADGATINGVRPSSEASFHAAILEARPEINVVLHFQTPCATALACRSVGTADYFMIPEIPYYIGNVAHVPYFAPGSPELAHAVTQAMRDHDLVQLANHGQVTAAKGFDGVIQNAEFFELACEIVLLGGDTVRPMSSHAAEALRMMRSQSVGRAV